MLTKEKVKKSIENLPESFMIDQLIEQLIFIEKVEEGLQQSEEGKVITNDTMKKLIDKWAK
jgi:predicted transcriptional regulator